MRVICIDDKYPETEGSIVHVKEGEYYEVYDSPYDDCYIVVGYEICPITGKYDCYLKSRFIPISTIDEKELIKERKKELA